MKHLLKKNGLKLSDLAQHVKQADGKPLSPSAISLIVNHGTYPKTTPRETIDQQIQTFLASHGIPVPTTNKQQQEEFVMRRITLSPEILAHFGLKRTPFPLHFESIEEVYQDKNRPLVGMIVDTARIGGLLAIVGESGAGKTTLLNCALERLRTEESNIIVIQLHGVLEEQQNIGKKPLSAKAISTSKIS